MRTSSKIKLNQLCKDELRKREINVIKGGAQCSENACEREQYEWDAAPGHLKVELRNYFPVDC